jgi:hypothetical protein
MPGKPSGRPFRHGFLGGGNWTGIVRKALARRKISQTFQWL